MHPASIFLIIDSQVDILLQHVTDCLTKLKGFSSPSSKLKYHPAELLNQQNNGVCQFADFTQSNLQVRSRNTFPAELTTKLA